MMVHEWLRRGFFALPKWHLHNRGDIYRKLAAKKIDVQVLYVYRIIANYISLDCERLEITQDICGGRVQALPLKLQYHAMKQ